ncbi:MAG: hypothetical protein LAT56_13775, partial [Wenzhouxiangella sp.]|nr:hypothetical protein [Wenzhouxiangella sp.]
CRTITAAFRCLADESHTAAECDLHTCRVNNFASARITNGWLDRASYALDLIEIMHLLARPATLVEA